MNLIESTCCRVDWRIWWQGEVKAQGQWWCCCFFHGQFDQQSEIHIHSWLNWNHVECVLCSLSCDCNLWLDLRIENWEWEYFVDVKYYVVCCLCQVLNLCGILCSLFAVALKSCTELDLYDAKYYVVKYYVVVLLACLLLLVILLLPVKYKWLCMHESCCWTMNHVFLLCVVWIFLLAVKYKQVLVLCYLLWNVNMYWYNHTGSNMNVLVQEVTLILVVAN